MGMPIITPSTTTRSQAITDMIESVALEQTALSHILNAEGEKMQAVVKAATTSDQLLMANTSVRSMINSIARLEMVLQSKLELFSDCLCPVVPCMPLTDTAIRASDSNAVVTKNSIISYTINLTRATGTGTLTVTTVPAGLPISVNGTLPNGLTFVSPNVLSYTNPALLEGATVKLNIGTGDCLQVLTIRFTRRYDDEIVTT